MREKNDILETITIGCLGESSVGKTSMIQRYVGGYKPDQNIPTIGVEFNFTKRILYNGKYYKIKICDTAGQEKYRSLCMNFIRNWDGAILVYDIANRDSFNSISNWTQNIYDIKDEDFLFILIGNKCDLEEKREVSKEEGLETAGKYNTLFFETSAIEGINIEKAFDELLNMYIKKNEENNNKKNNNLKLDKKIKKKRKIC